jgi:hypothetical protein
MKRIWLAFALALQRETLNPWITLEFMQRKLLRIVPVHQKKTARPLRAKGLQNELNHMANDLNYSCLGSKTPRKILDTKFNGIFGLINHIDMLGGWRTLISQGEGKRVLCLAFPDLTLFLFIPLVLICILYLKKKNL